MVDKKIAKVIQFLFHAACSGPSSLLFPASPPNPGCKVMGGITDYLFEQLIYGSGRRISRVLAACPVLPFCPLHVKPDDSVQRHL